MFRQQALTSSEGGTNQIIEASIKPLRHMKISKMYDSFIEILFIHVLFS